MLHALSTLFRRASAPLGSVAARAVRTRESAAANAAAARTAATPAPVANCFHCGLPVPPGARDQVMFEGVAHTVCCAACATVAETVICNGYGDYYRERDRLATQR